MLATDHSTQLAANEAVFELPGDQGGPPTSMWVRTCEFPGCECGNICVLVTDAGREAVIQQGALFTQARKAGARHSRAAHGLDPGTEHFFLDLPTVTASWVLDEAEHDMSGHPRIAGVLRRLHGEILEEIGRLWYRGKGKPLPEEQLLQAPKVVMEKGWTPGDLVGWQDLDLHVREDLYLFEDVYYQAMDQYCITPSCLCDEAIIEFAAPKGEKRIRGVVAVSVRSGRAELQARGSGEPRLARAWKAFVTRHPEYRAALARRYDFMKQVGVRAEMANGSRPFAAASPAHDLAVAAGPQPAAGAPPRAAAPPAPLAQEKVGRNDPCPCGSGRKFKKCCGAAA